MKILFLDVDGVLNCRRTTQEDGWPIDPYMVLLVDRIIQATGCVVVLSSAWRHSEKGREIVRRAVDFRDTTPRLDGQPRGAEVQAYIDSLPFKSNMGNEPLTTYAILDDWDDFLPGQPLFRTSFEFGITEEISKQVIEHLNAKP